MTSGEFASRGFRLVLLTGFVAAIGLAVSPAAAQPYKEAPALAELVQAGELPPVEERLPANPMVVPVVESIGTYGGTWRTALLGGEDGAWQVRTMGYENLVRWTPEWDGWIPNVAESYEVSEDSREFTFKLREGMRWSDGEPYTADDIMFWYEDVFLNPELTPNKQAWLMSGDEPVVVEKLGDYEVKFRFAEPNGIFLRGLADVRGVRVNAHPRHYFEQFHPKYNPNVDELVREAGVIDWAALFTLKGGGSNDDVRWWNRELPTLNGWISTVGMGDSTTQMVAERNPYYWKVDPEGNQLPYIDRITYDFVEDVEVLLLRALSGEIDIMDRHLATATNKAVLFDGMEAGGYHFYDTVAAAPNTAIVALNLSHKDPVKRELFRNKDFRIGLSHAINRQETSDVVYIGQATPYQVAPLPDSKYYNEQLATQYTEYDVDLANEYLDKAGLTERDAEGFRLGPDGQRVTLALDVYTSYQPLVDSMELVAQYWQEVGINALLRPGDRSLVTARVEVADYDVYANRPIDGGAGETVITHPQSYYPHNSLANWALGWVSWNSVQHGGEPLGAPVEEPPESVKRQIELYDAITREGDNAKQADLMREILQIAADNFYVLGLTTEPLGYGVVKNNVRNVPDRMFNSYSWPTPAPTNPVQYYFEGGRNSAGN
jgi:peptide/nickel transport system substrate-binding protein